VEQAADWDAKFARRTPPGDPIQAVVDRVASLKPGHAVDLGCGGGRHARWLAAAGWTVDAVDWSGVGITMGQQGGAANNITWTVSDVAQWQPTRPIHLVLMSYLHLRVEVMTGLLARVPRWLSDDGQLLYLGHAPQHALGGPPVDMRPSLVDLAQAVSGLQVIELAHLLNTNDAGAVDIVLHAQSWPREQGSSSR
jgi:SAM-dependent methyltransferase